MYVTWCPRAAAETAKCTPNASWNEWPQRQGHSLLPQGRQAPLLIPNRLLAGQQSGSGQASAAPSLLGDEDNDGNSLRALPSYHQGPALGLRGLVLLAFSYRENFRIHFHQELREGGKEGRKEGKKEGRKGGREGGREGGKKGGREGGRQGGRKGGRKEGENKEETEMERWRERWREKGMERLPWGRDRRWGGRKETARCEDKTNCEI